MKKKKKKKKKKNTKSNVFREHNEIILLHFYKSINQLHEKFVKSWFYIWNTVQSFSQKNNDEWKGKILDAMKA